MRLPTALLACLAMLGFCVAPLAAVSVPYRLEPVPHPNAEPPGEVTLHVFTAETVTSGSEPRVVALSGDQGFAGTLDLAPGSWWIEPVAVGYWSPGRWVTVPDRYAKESVDVAPEPLAFLLYPTQRVSAPVRLTEAGDLPTSIEVEVAPVPASVIQAKSSKERVSGIQPAGTLRCPVADGVLRCALPLGYHDLRLKAQGFASQYLWEVRLDGEGQVRWPALVLSPGAAVSGFVEVAGVRALPPGLWIELSPQRIVRPPEVMRDRLERMRLSAVPDDRGWFQIEDVEPGTYELLVGGPGLTTVRRTPVRVLAQRESIFREPILLTPPSEVMVSVRPSTDPRGEPWRLSLTPEDDLHDRVAGQVDTTGGWTAKNLAPGSHRLRVEDSLGAVWRTQTIQVAEEGGLVEIDLSPLEVVGSLVDADGEPVQATVIFEDGDGVALRWPTDAEGSFEGSLPRDGPWLVRVSPRGARTLPLEPVRLERPPSGEVLEVHLELPATRLEGRVVDGTGEGVPAARIQLIRMGKAGGGSDRREVLETLDKLTTETDGDGSFSIRGLRPGRYAVSALRPAPHRVFGDGQSEQETVEITAGVETVELQILDRPVFLGRVLAPSGGAVVGARVQVRPHAADSRLMNNIDGRVTDFEGRFEMDVPPGTEAVTVVVDAPGYPTWLERRPWSPGGVLEFTVRQLGGRLAIEWPAPPPGALPRVPVLHHEGAWIGLPALGARARLNHGGEGGRRQWVHPEVAMGSYQICPTRYLDERCTSGYLSPAGELTLSFKGFGAPPDS